MKIDLFTAGDLIFNVGANTGNKTAQFLEFGATVVCFEPQAHCAKQLRQRFEDSPRVKVVQKGLADRQGALTLSICEADTLSTFSSEWKRGRHAGQRWTHDVIVDVTTLDLAIAEFGRPKYCKIDVEGLEISVLRGLTQPLDALSFEFTMEFIDNAAEAVGFLTRLGMEEFTVAIAEDDHFATDHWIDGKSLMSAIRGSGQPGLWGDIYARSPRRTNLTS